VVELSPANVLVRPGFGYDDCVDWVKLIQLTLEDYVPYIIEQILAENPLVVALRGVPPLGDPPPLDYPNPFPTRGYRTRS
jgi:hypothetical protein